VAHSFVESFAWFSRRRKEDCGGGRKAAKKCIVISHLSAALFEGYIRRDHLEALSYHTILASPSESERHDWVCHCLASQSTQGLKRRSVDTAVSVSIESFASVVIVCCYGR
jgi:hypothetical protein